MKLYELTQNYKNLLELLENDEVEQEVINNALNSVEGDLTDKIENIAKLIKSLEADINIFTEEEKRMLNRRKVLERKVTSLKSYISACLEATGKDKVKGNMFTIAMQNNPPSVCIDSEKDIPMEYFNEPQPTVNKKLILEDLKSGKEIPGANLQQTKSLRIK